MNLLDLGKSVSAAFEFDKTDALKTLRHALVVGAAATLSALIDSVGNLNLGVYSQVMTPLISMALNGALRYIKANE